MKKKRIYLEPIHNYAYRRPHCDSPLITGLVLVEPDGLNERICFEITYDDGYVDHVPTSDVDAGYYRFATQ